jgi:hypothetical protein
MLVLGPPRSGKTSTLVVPNVLAAPGPVLITSTKADVLRATLGQPLAARAVLALGPDRDHRATAGGPPGAMVPGTGLHFLG